MMTSDSTVAKTPHYVLKDGHSYFGPPNEKNGENVVLSLIYGFSDKEPYDRFCLNSKTSLTPYPLVKGYLRNHASMQDMITKLIILDPSKPNELSVLAATVQAVLEAQDSNSTQVIATHRLSFNQQLNCYQAEPIT